MRSPMWTDTAIFLTWDDYGGFYDHVPPPQVDDFGFGIRVPMMVLSPYSKQGKVSGELGEFSSVLRFIEDNWGLTQLTKRDQQAHADALGVRFRAGAEGRDPLRSAMTAWARSGRRNDRGAGRQRAFDAF